MISAPYGGCWIVPPPLYGLRRFGQPPGGPFDSSLAGIAQEIAPSRTVIEISSPLLVRASEPIRLGFAAPRGSQMIPGRIADIAALDFSPGDQMTFQAPRNGVRAYLSVPGLWESLRTPQPLPPDGGFSTSSATAPTVIGFDDLREDSSPILHILDSSLSEPVDAMITPVSSRAGVRIRASIEAWPPLMRSEPCIMGAIQLTPGGELLIHGPDGPTLGGYPVVGCVALADLPKVAQLAPGESCRLVPNSHAEARRRHMEAMEQQHQLAAKVRAAYGLRPFPS